MESLIEQISTEECVVVNATEDYRLEQYRSGMCLERLVDGCYIPFEAEEIPALLDAIERLGLDAVGKCQFLIGVSEVIH